jgi:hypothetical protein
MEEGNGKPKMKLSEGRKTIFDKIRVEKYFDFIVKKQNVNIPMKIVNISKDFRAVKVEVNGKTYNSVCEAIYDSLPKNSVDPKDIVNRIRRLAREGDFKQIKNICAFTRGEKKIPFSEMFLEDDVQTNFDEYAKDHPDKIAVTDAPTPAPPAPVPQKQTTAALAANFNPALSKSSGGIGIDFVSAADKQLNLLKEIAEHSAEIASSLKTIAALKKRKYDPESVTVPEQSPKKQMPESQAVIVPPVVIAPPEPQPPQQQAMETTSDSAKPADLPENSAIDFVVD